MNMSSASWLQDFYIGEKIQEEKIFSIFTATYFSHNNLFLNQWNQPNAQLPHQPNYVSSTSSASSASSASSNSHSNGNSNNNNNNNNNNNSISLSSNINSISNNNNNNNINQQLVLKNNNNVINGINTTNNNNNNNNVFKLDQSSSPLILKQQQQFPKIKDKEKDKDKDQDQSTSLTNNPTVSTTSTSSTTSTLLSATSINLVSPRTDINNNNNNNGYIKTHIKGASSASSIPTPPSALLQPTPAIVSSNTTSTTSTTTSSKQSTSSSSSQTQPVTVGAPQTPHLAKHFSLENVNYDGVSSGGSSSSSSSLSGLSVPPITYTGASANSGTPSSASRHAEILFSNQKVLLKIINTKYPSMDLMSLFQREFAILSILNNIDGVIKVLRAQTEVGSIFAFVLEDSGFKPLTSVFSSMGPPTPTSLQGNRSTSTSTSTNNTTTTSSSSSQQSSESRESSLNNSQTRSTPNSGDTASTQSSSLSPASQSNKLPTPQSSSPIITSTTAIKFQDMDLMTFINISIQLAKILEEIHLRGCIHRDIRPSNIYISNGIVKLANFQFSVIKLSNGQTIDNSLLYLKTFPEIGRYNSTSYYYSSPEETGRTQHTVDYRSDLYSLGVTFYELLTNRLPFQTNDLSELIHAHLAKKAPFVSDLNYNVPPILSKIIDKLLKKSPDERYNSAYGLRRDLEICKSQISSNCTTDGFELGIYDVLHRPHIPTELYSRKNELNAIYQSVNRVCKGNKEFIFVSGGSGVGKTSLINAAKKKAPSGPRFIAGKFDLYNRGVPYSAIIEALNELMHMILVLSPVELAFYKEKLHRSLGPNVGVIVNVIPLLELIVGQYPPVPALPPSESQNRFDLAFKDFLRVFSEEGHPLVLFLDDLQRADEGSCRLIKLILENNNNLRHLLIIGAYREDNTAFTNTNKQHWLSLCEEISIPVTRISLKPLDLMDVNYLVASSLHKHPNETYVLSEVVLSKTHGNPFFTIQFLKTLFNENLVFFDVNCDSWKWDITNIQTRQYTDNVVEFMVSNLQQLSIESQRVMQLASCIGNIFDLDMLSVVAECTTEEILRLLTPIIAQDLILNIDDRKYRFVHDRVQQAAYSLVLQGKEKPEIHLNIGRSLYANAGGCIDKDQSTIFDIVNQYNVGMDLVTTRDERLILGNLNYIAGKKAKASAAYAIANSYLECALATLFLPDAWEENYQTTYNIFIEKSECDFMCGNINESERLLEIVIERSKTLEDRGEAIALKIQQYTLLSRFSDCAQHGITYLADMGIHILRNPSEDDLRKEYQNIKDQLGERSFLELLNNPQASDSIRVCSKVMGIMIAPLFFTNIKLLSALLIKLAEISITYGCTPWSSVGLVMFAPVVCIGTFDDFSAGYECGKLAMELKEMHNEPSTKGKVTLLFGNFINHWREHMSTNAALIKLSFLESVESGDMGYACYSSVHLVFANLLAGVPLVDVFNCSKKHIAFVEQYNFIPMLRILQSHQQFVVELIGPKELPDDDIARREWDEYGFEADLEMIEIDCPKAFHYVFKMQHCYMLGRYDKAWQSALKTEQFIPGIFGHSPMSIYYMYKSLTILKLFDERNRTINDGDADLTVGVIDDTEQKERLEMVEHCVARLIIYASNSKQNFYVMVLLVQAELCHVHGKYIEAMELFSEAISEAQLNKYVQYEALANEMAARMYVKLTKYAVARAYLLEAQLCYSMWGATAKAAQLEMEYPHIFNPISSRTPNSLSVGMGHTRYAVDVAPSSTHQHVEPRLSIRRKSHDAQAGLAHHSDKGGQSSLQQTTGSIQSINNLQQSSKQSVQYPQVDAFDLCSVITVSHSLAEEIYYDRLLKRLMKVVIRNAGASRGYLLLLDDVSSELFPNDHANPGLFGDMNVAASACVTGDKVNVEVYINRGTVADKDLEPLEASPNILSPVLKSFSFLNIQPPNQYQQHSSSSSSSSTQQPLSLSQSQQQMEEFNKAIRDDGNWNLCSSMINYVQRTQSPLLISNAADDKTFSDDPYVKFQRPKSVLVLPIVHQGKLVSILYLENNFTTGAFTSGRMEVLNLLSTQIAVSFQNARLFLQTNHLANQAFLAKEEAERANKAKSDFISNMSHEMRTPLNHIIGSLELLQTFPLSSDQKELLSISQQSSESLLFMVNNILDLSKVEQGKTVLNYTSFNLVSFLEENIGAIANNAHQKGLMVGMYCYPCTSEVPVIGDKNLLRQVLVNLLSNAIKFTSKGEVFVKVNITPNTIDTTKINLNEKSLTPTLRSQQKQLQQIHQQQQHQQQQQLSTEVPPTTTFNLLSVNQDSSNSNSNSNSNSPYLGSANNNNSTTTQIKSYSIFIEVRDSGIGIKQRDFDKLFQRFSQIDSGVNRAYDGSGLGLSICKQLIELMNGEIGINSKIGEGSIFHFSLEMAKPPSEHIKPSGELSLFRDNTNIIILEDNKTIRGQIEEAISSFGIKQINSSTFSNINLSLYLSSSDDFLLAKNNNIIIIGLPLNYNEDHVMNLIDNINLIKERSASNNLDIKVDFVVITQLALTSSKSMLQECGILLVNRPIKRDALLKTLADLTREQTIGRSYSQQNIHQHLGSGNQHHHHSFNRSHSPIGQLVNSPTIKRSVSSPKLGVIVTDDNNCHQFAPPPLRSREKEALSFLDLNKSPPISPIIKQPPQHHLLNNAPLVNGASSPTIQLPILVKKRAPNVLVIEDNELNAIILFKMLEKIGITNPDSAINGVEGVEKASNGNYDLILMDIQMPVMDGYEATNRIRQLEGSIKHTPIVAMTANAMGGQREACLRAGCDDYFCKPLKQKDLEQVIKKFLNYDDYLILLKQQQEHAATILQQQQQQQNIVTPSS